MLFYYNEGMNYNPYPHTVSCSMPLTTWYDHYS